MRDEKKNREALMIITIYIEKVKINYKKLKDLCI